MATIKPKNMEDREILVRFFYDITSHTMYTPIIDELMNSPGFFKKEMVMVENKEGRVATNKIVFVDKETFDEYVNNEAHQSLWDYLTVLAEEAGLSIEITDIEV
jgi:hypothetical protein